MFRNEISALSLAALLCTVVCAPALSSTKNALSTKDAPVSTSNVPAPAGKVPAVTSDAPSSKRNAISDDTWQVNPAMNLCSLFPDADRIIFAVGHDPLVLGYRRLYGLELVAIELGFLRNG